MRLSTPICQTGTWPLKNSTMLDNRNEIQSGNISTYESKVRRTPLKRSNAIDEEIKDKGRITEWCGNKIRKIQNATRKFINRFKVEDDEDCKLTPAQIKALTGEFIEL
ncbi:hypothetical protein PVAND_001544 [Polypedilum vanderplanki]|uniref:Uncharacterized protein n=1 Tax=Polypedilum vanderplanki TaxID=319348 RepID=A0A9J6BNR3_POLVA|nr:hypothetical protein PVAND_001544 [Polypedilum vanderplanki]